MILADTPYIIKITPESMAPVKKIWRSIGMKMSKRVLCTLLAVVLLTAFAACGSNKTPAGGNETAADSSQLNSTQPSDIAEPVVSDAAIKWMHHFGEESARDWIKKITEKYTGETGIKVDVQAVGYDDYQTLLKAKIASGDAPDFFDLTPSDLSMFTKNNYVADLGECAFWDNLIDGTKENTAIDGVNYFLPFEAGASAAFYNIDVFEKLGITEMPQTYDEFIATLKKIKDGGIIPIAFGSQEWWTFINDYKAAELQHNLRNDNKWFDNLESRKKKFVDDSIFVENLTKFRSRYNYGNDDQFGTDWNKATEMVATGKAAMVINGNWAIGAIKEKNPNARIGAFAVPVTDDPNETVITSWLSGGFIVYEKSPVKEKVFEFIDTSLTSKESGEIWLAAGRLSSVKDLPAAEDPALADISRYMSEGKAFDVSSMKVDFSGEFLNAEVDAFSQFLMDQIKDPKEVAKLLDKKFDEIAEKQGK
jgi:raffinose/stachyose/melibiose transport system substrate-binding protein